MNDARRGQHRLSVVYEGIVVGEYVVEQVPRVELKAAWALDEADHAQCINDLKASGPSLRLLLNFGTPRLEIRRVVSGL